MFVCPLLHQTECCGQSAMDMYISKKNRVYFIKRLFLWQYLIDGSSDNKHWEMQREMTYHKVPWLDSNQVASFYCMDTRYRHRLLSPRGHPTYYSCSNQIPKYVHVQCVVYIFDTLSVVGSIRGEQVCLAG